MAQYSRSASTKKKILDTARTLFWEKGYENTRYEDLAQIAGINPGLVHYHFKTKAGLAQAIYREVANATFHIIDTLVDSRTDILLYDFVDTLAVWQWYASSPNFRRFSYEIAKLGVPFHKTDDLDMYIYQRLCDKYNLGFSKREVLMYNRLSYAVEGELLLSYIEDETKLSPIEYAKYEIAYSFHFREISQQEVQDTIARAEALVNQYHFICKDGFSFSCEKRITDVNS